MESTPQEQSRHFTAKGEAAVRSEQDLAWLLSERRARLPILTELGRIGEPEAIRHVAAHICQRKPRADEAVAMIRGWRDGKSPSPVALEVVSP